MACDLIEKILAIEGALASLRDRCAFGFTLPDSRACAVPYLLTMIQAATAIRDGGYGVTESVSRPDVPACVTGSFLDGVLAWIDGMACGGVGTPPAVYLWFISERETETYSIRLTYDGEPYGAAPGFEDGSGAVAWYNLVPNRFAEAGAHVAQLTASFPEDAETWEYLFDPSYSRWLLEVAWADRVKFFVSRSDPGDAANIEAYAEDGITATFTVVGSVVATSMYNTWLINELPEDTLEHD